MIELGNRNGQAVLKNYAFAEKTSKIESSRTEDIISRSAEIIKKMYKEAGFTSRETVAALHNFDVFTSVINLPETDLADLESIIRVEAHKFVPIPLEDVVLDWKVVGAIGDKHKKAKDKKKAVEKPAPDKKESTKVKSDETKNAKLAGLAPEDLLPKDERGLEVLLTAAPRKLVKKYVEIFKAAELNLLSLETESFSYIRALLPKNDNSPVMVLNVGAVASDIIIVEKQIPVIIRTVDGGGFSITEAIAHNLGISIERAEQFKRDVGIYAPDGTDSNHVIRQLVESAFVPVVNEISYSLELYKTRNQNVEKILLTGGSAYLLHLSDFLKSTFKIPVYIGDPWHRITYAPEMQKVLQEIGPMFTVAVGLALKQIVE
ncbi:MAG: hypothetical protein A2295_03225 [Candidatus Jacksonbacteria bacterium RIFOXYB2_FULL_44_15]|nr:MAG: hypothetical protein A2295_03225 [Candidatus Jacksonbacteria bacterium RIFOXYB2_FULL_44_15]OGY76334.1 MAG: hypothetical protein A2240_04185 [Candidatus Jacksonbacteria bacterium RIFOXYA2_FULL_43_12]OGY81545.1 MAG: hypothetical protein A2550_00905 [Candidatus Jacksonbacteria bacterium RIFOXYD2_FULL_43_21]